MVKTFSPDFQCISVQLWAQTPHWPPPSLSPVVFCRRTSLRPTGGASVCRMNNLLRSQLWRTHWTQMASLRPLNVLSHSFVQCPSLGQSRSALCHYSSAGIGHLSYSAECNKFTRKAVFTELLTDKIKEGTRRRPDPTKMKAKPWSAP